MPHSAKYIIHADVRTSGVVERSDVVGAIYGQTEGLLGDELDLRDLQESSKVGRIDVDIDSEGGRSFGTVRIATGLDRAETAVLAAALETIERVGPSRAECTVREIEDARAAKRREIVDRATELLTDFEERSLTSEQLVKEVRQRARAGEITEYHDLPAGPHVADSDAIIIVEGRADVRKLLSYGIKNAIAVEGTDIPDAVARLTSQRTTTAFLDGDRGGDLILQELTQVGEVDYVAFAPSGRSVEELDREEVLTGLRKKLPYEQVAEANTAREAFAPTDGGTVTGPVDDDDGLVDEVAAAAGEESPASKETNAPEAADETKTHGAAGETETSGAAGETETSGAAGETTTADAPESTTDREGEPEPSVESAEAATESSPAEGVETADGATAEAAADAEADVEKPRTLGDHVAAVVESDAGTARLLDRNLEVLADVPAEEAFGAVESAETVPHTVVLDGPVTQRLLDIAAQRGVGQVVGAETGEFVKQPATVRVHTAAELLG
jgi:DNA primase